ncbi:MAG TPA: SDR family oxidoreductase, partial [Cyclobacteriaceae bacterium]|nr:SDR family oxidoreductase [Cyclobacteriaceae bacterium]
IVIYDNLSRPNFGVFLGGRKAGSEKIKFYKGELLDSRHLKMVLRGIDVVYHLAARVTTPFANGDGHLYEQVNHWGTAELVYAVEESDVKKFIYTSSSGVYGDSDDVADEQFPAMPKSFYAISKLRGEEHVRRLMHKKETYIFRCGNVYGYNRGMRFDAVINKFVFEANFQKRITVHGDGSQSRAFIHINSAGTALASVLKTDLPGGTYNLVEQNIKIIDVVDELKQLIPDLEFIFINQHLTLRELKVKANDLVNEKLGIQTPVPLKEALQEFINRFGF